MKRISGILTAAICLLWWCTLLAQKGEAPPVVWQKDLDSAIRESYLSGRPLVLHFCPPGRISLNEDMSTFLEEGIKVASTRFVWVRLDPQQFRELGDKYDVEEIPSLVVVDHARKKLNTTNVEGHAFAEDIFKLMKQVLAGVKVPKPEDIEKLKTAFKSAQKFMEKKKLRKAVTLLRKVARFKLKIGYVKEAGKALAAIEENARNDIEKAKKLVCEGKTKEADKILRRIEKDLRGLDAAREARKTRLELYGSRKELKELQKKEREKQAQRLLRLARMYEDNGKLEKALEQHEKILEKYPGTEAAAEAADKVKELKAGTGTQKDPKEDE